MAKNETCKFLEDFKVPIESDTDEKVHTFAYLQLEPLNLKFSRRTEPPFFEILRQPPPDPQGRIVKISRISFFEA